MAKQKGILMSDTVYSSSFKYRTFMMIFGMFLFSDISIKDLRACDKDKPKDLSLKRIASTDSLSIAEEAKVDSDQEQSDLNYLFLNACKEGLGFKAIFYLQEGADINSVDDMGRNAAHLAVLNNRPYILKHVLLVYKINISHKDNNHKTACDYAQELEDDTCKTILNLYA